MCLAQKMSNKNTLKPLNNSYSTQRDDITNNCTGYFASLISETVVRLFIVCTECACLCVCVCGGGAGGVGICTE